MASPGPKLYAHALFGLALTLASTGCSGAAEVPDTPNLAELLSQYAQPSATLDSARARSVLEMAASDVETLAAGFQALGLADAGVNEASANAGKSDGDGIRLQGSVRVTVRCPGDLSGPVYDEAVNGSLAITLGVDASRILRGVAGQATRCTTSEEFLGRRFRVVLDGPFALDLGGDIGIGKAGTRQLLVSLSGSISIGDIEFSNVTGRLSRNGFESLLVLTDEKTVILNVGLDGSIAVRDLQGTWRCATNELECSFE